MQRLHCHCEPYIAIIFGWLGSTVDKLKVYDRLHRELGATLVVIIMCSLAELMDPEFVRRGVDTNLACYEKSSRVIVHVFGNGGMLLYHQVFVDHPTLASRVTAVIFDSTPGKWFTPKAFLGVSKSTEKPVLQRMLALLPLSVSVAVLLRVLLRRQPRVVLTTTFPLLLAWWAQCRFNSIYFNYCVHDPVSAPALFLYSSKDSVVNSSVIEHIVGERRQRLKKGILSSLARAVSEHYVRARCWKDSSHVAHYEAHPVEYRQELKSLMKEVLPSHKEKVRRVSSLPVLAEVGSFN